MSPNAVLVAQVSRETGAPEQTLYNWRNQVCEQGKAVPAYPKSPERWSGESKLTVVIETAPLNEEHLVEYCRHKGLYAEQIQRWREAAATGACHRRILCRSWQTREFTSLLSPASIGSCGRRINYTNEEKPRHCVQLLSPKDTRQTVLTKFGAGILVCRSKLRER